MGDWRSIESAPKDGTEFLVVAKGRVRIGCWSTPNVIAMSLPEATRRERGIAPGWVYWEASEGGEYHMAIKADIKLWQPLPDPPPLYRQEGTE